MTGALWPDLARLDRVEMGLELAFPLVVTSETRGRLSHVSASIILISHQHPRSPYPSGMKVIQETRNEHDF